MKLLTTVCLLLTTTFTTGCGVLAPNADTNLSKLYESTKQATVVIEYKGEEVEATKQDIGTGFFVDGTTVCTAKHVHFTPKGTFYIRTSTGNEYTLGKFWHSKQSDICFLKVVDKVTGIRPLKFASKNPSLFEKLMTIGTPLHIPFHPSIGIVTQYSDGYEMTDIATYPGNSGGPVVNYRGEIVGLVSGVGHYHREDYVEQDAVHLSYIVPVEAIYNEYILMITSLQE